MLEFNGMLKLFSFVLSSSQCDAYAISPWVQNAYHVITHIALSFIASHPGQIHDHQAKIRLRNTVLTHSTRISGFVNKNGIFSNCGCYDDDEKLQ